MTLSEKVEYNQYAITRCEQVNKELTKTHPGFSLIKSVYTQSGRSGHQFAIAHLDLRDYNWIYSGLYDTLEEGKAAIDRAIKRALSQI